MPSNEATDFTDVTLLSEDNMRNQNRSNQGSKATKDHSHCSVTHHLPHDLQTNHGSAINDSKQPHGHQLCHRPSQTLEGAEKTT